MLGKVAELSATALSICVMGALVPRMYRISKTGKSDDFNFFTFPLQLSNCVAWSIWALFISWPKVELGPLVVNVIGFFIAVYYCLVFALVTPFDDPNVGKFLFGVFSLLAIVLVPTSVMFLIEAKLSLIADYNGVLGNISAILFFLAPLTSLVTVVKEKNSRSLSLPLSLFGALASVCWVVYALQADPVLTAVVIPNSIAGVLNSIQLSACLIYRSTESPEEPQGVEMDTVQAEAQV